ncbi:MAG: hypothetical protein ACOYI5_02140 [Christensenellales bacterium]|jgi:hypothetical protein
MPGNRDAAIAWLLEDKDPIVKYRAQTELLGECPDKEATICALRRLLPNNWQAIEGLWAVYWLTAIAESGLTLDDLSIDISQFSSHYNAHSFDMSCADFMRLRAMARLGIDIPQPMLDDMRQNQLPDGGFLCLHRLKKLSYTPKSCVKANMHALMFVAECKKRGFLPETADALLSYFWNHKLFYRSDRPDELILQARAGWRTIDTFFPFEVMRVGLQNIIEALSALGYGEDALLAHARQLLDARKTQDGAYILDGTLQKSYLPKERRGKPSKWVTLYALLAEKHSGI